MTTPTYDIVVFGATSFVGQILCRYLSEQFNSDNLRWAMAGRSQEKLEQVRSGLGAVAQALPLIVADAADDKAMADLCVQTRVVVSTVGPYALYGEPLVKACAESGTDYCDLTGEAPWIKQMQDRYEASAKQSGARIVHCCGFDSMPSDLGVLMVQQQAQAKFGEPANQIRMRVTKMRGGASGGTIASMINIAKDAAGDAELRKDLANPYSTCPPDHGFKARQHNPKTEYDLHHQSWVAPFVMAAINTRVVHRSNALSGASYGTPFLYEEGVLTGDKGKGKRRARIMGLGLGGFMLLVVLPPTRWLLERFFLPKPGEGPSPEEQLNGGFAMHFNGITPSGKQLCVEVTGDRDPGYGSTGKMLGQAAACLAFDLPEDTPGGFWTPATVLGTPLIERLKKDAGLTFEVVEH